MQDAATKGMISRTVDFILWSYDQYDWIHLLLIVMALDWLSGVAASLFVEKNLSSRIGFKGAMKKVSLILVVAVGIVLEQAMKSTIPEGIRQSYPLPLAKLVAGWFLFNESLSVLENAKRCGVPLPNFLSKSLRETINNISNISLTGGTEKVSLDIQNAHLEAKITSKPQDGATLDSK